MPFGRTYSDGKRRVPDRPELFLSQRCKSLLPEQVWADPHALRKVLRALSRADRRTVLAAVRSHLARNAPCDVEVGVVARDGRELRLKLRAMAEIDSAGRVLRIAGSLSDVTELRQREARIQRSDAFLGRLVDLLPLPVLVKNEERRYVIVNRAAEQIFSAARGAATPRRGVAALAVEFAETQLRDDAYVLGQGVPVSREIEYNSPPGERLALQVRKAPITDTEGAPAVLTVITDVSPQHLC